MFPKSIYKAGLESVSGKVAVPILLYFLGVPGIVVFFLWLFIFKGA